MYLSLPLLTQSILSGLLIGGILALIAVGLNLIFGVMRVLNFAHGQFVMLSMYLCYWLCIYFQLNPYYSLILGVPIFFLLGIIVQKFLINHILEASEHSQIILTLALALFFESLAVILWTPDYRTINLGYEKWVYQFHDVALSFPRFIGFILALAVTLSLYLFLTKTDFGNSIRAASDNRKGALIIGINVKRIYYITFGLGTVCAAIAGAIMTTFFYIFPQVGMKFTLTSFVIVVLGGLGSFGGALIGGLAVGLVESLTVLFLPGTLKELVTFTLLIIILIWKPGGLLGAPAR